MTRTEQFPLDIPPTLNEATGPWERFAKEGFEATRWLVDNGWKPYLRGSRILRMVLPDKRKPMFDEVRQLVRYGQRMVPIVHGGTAAHPDHHRPIDNQIEIKTPSAVTEFANLTDGLMRHLKLTDTHVLLCVPSYLNPQASPALRTAYERLTPYVRITRDTGVIPGRNMPFAGIKLESDWVGAGSVQPTLITQTWWRVYPTGGDTDMRNPKNCTNVDGLWGAVTVNATQTLTVSVPELPTRVTLPESAIELHSRNLARGNQQAAINVADVIARGLGNGTALGIHFGLVDESIAANWMNQANTILSHDPMPHAMKRNIAIRIRAAEYYEPEYTREFLKNVRFACIEE